MLDDILQFFDIHDVT